MISRLNIAPPCGTQKLAHSGRRYQLGIHVKRAISDCVEGQRVPGIVLEYDQSTARGRNAAQLSELPNTFLLRYVMKYTGREGEIENVILFRDTVILDQKLGFLPPVNFFRTRQTLR